ncbi:MAG: ECF transporter S component [Halanaeroarchaeum sp.]
MNTAFAEEVRLDARNVALSAVFAAAVAVATYAVPLSIGAGYFNLGEVLIYTAAFLFGPVVGGLAGGVGAAAADVYLGYMMWAPITFVVKGLEGAVVGYLSGDSSRRKVLAVAAGAPIMIVGYFVAAAYLVGFPYAIGNELPADVMQAVIGLAVALPLSKAVEARVPQLK